jgi:hypothetical protein
MGEIPHAIRQEDLNNETNFDGLAERNNEKRVQVRV